MKLKLLKERLVVVSVLGGGLFAPPTVQADVVAGSVMFSNVDRTWAWGDSMGGGGDDSIGWWLVTTSGATELVAEAKSGTQASGTYAYAHVVSTVHMNSVADTPLRIQMSDFAYGFVQADSPHTWEMASVRFGTGNSADFLVTGGYYRYHGPAPLQYMGTTVQSGGIVGPGICRVTSFAMPEAYVKVYRNQSVQNGPHYWRLDFTFTPLCPSDINHDGWVNGDDFDEFTQWFDAGDARADYDGNGWVNGDDFDAFAIDFDAGC